MEKVPEYTTKTQMIYTRTLDGGYRVHPFGFPDFTGVGRTKEEARADLDKITREAIKKGWSRKNEADVVLVRSFFQRPKREPPAIPGNEAC